MKGILSSLDCLEGRCDRLGGFIRVRDWAPQFEVFLSEVSMCAEELNKRILSVVAEVIATTPD